METVERDEHCVLFLSLHIYYPHVLLQTTYAPTIQEKGFDLMRRRTWTGDRSNPI